MTIWNKVKKRPREAMSGGSKDSGFFHQVGQIFQQQQNRDKAVAKLDGADAMLAAANAAARSRGHTPASGASSRPGAAKRALAAMDDQAYDEDEGSRHEVKKTKHHQPPPKELTMAEALVGPFAALSPVAGAVMCRSTRICCPRRRSPLSRWHASRAGSS